jgi:hypothetical protein
VPVARVASSTPTKLMIRSEARKNLRAGGRRPCIKGTTNVLHGGGLIQKATANWPEVLADRLLDWREVKHLVGVCIGIRGVARSVGALIDGTADGTAKHVLTPFA